MASPSTPIAAGGSRANAVESWTSTADDVAAWLRTARQGERMIYAHGPSLIHGAAAALVRKLNDSGEVIAHNKRADDGGFDYIVIRNRVRVAVEKAGSASAAVVPIDDPCMSAILLKLKEAARLGQRSPSDAGLGRLTGLTRNQVAWRLRKLEHDGIIRCRVVATCAEPKFRIVTIVATGAETAGPRGGL